jgi:hypothetical protein
MLNISFYLREPQGERATPIVMRLVLEGYVTSLRHSRELGATKGRGLGRPRLTIMAISRNKTEKAFLRYIKLEASDHAKLLKAHWEREKLTSQMTGGS